jgi:hypothetical protein
LFARKWGRTAYRETISDARLKAVTDHVPKWLFGESPQPQPELTPVPTADPPSQPRRAPASPPTTP